VVAVLLLAGLPGVFADIGLGLISGYPVCPGGGQVFEWPYAGGLLRLKGRHLFCEAEYSRFWGGEGFYFFSDLGFSLDKRRLRFGLAAGINEANNRSFWQRSVAAKASLEYLLGRLSLGLSSAIPLFRISSSPGDDDAAHLVFPCTVELVYWFRSQLTRTR
jgi:hypothetical protein